MYPRIPKMLFISPKFNFRTFFVWHFKQSIRLLCCLFSTSRPGRRKAMHHEILPCLPKLRHRSYFFFFFFKKKPKLLLVCFFSPPRGFVFSALNHWPFFCETLSCPSRRKADPHFCTSPSTNRVRALFSAFRSGLSQEPCFWVGSNSWKRPADVTVGVIWGSTKGQIWTVDHPRMRCVCVCSCLSMLVWTNPWRNTFTVRIIIEF